MAEQKNRRTETKKMEDTEKQIHSDLLYVNVTVHHVFDRHFRVCDGVPLVLLFSVGSEA